MPQSKNKKQRSVSDNRPSKCQSTKDTAKNCAGESNRSAPLINNSLSRNAPNRPIIGVPAGKPAQAPTPAPAANLLNPTPSKPAPAWGPRGAWAARGAPRPVSGATPQPAQVAVQQIGRAQQPVRPAPAPSQNATAGEKMTEEQLMEKYNAGTFRMAPKKPSPQRRGIEVTTSLVSVNWRATRPFSIYKYDLKVTVITNGIRKQAKFNKEEMTELMRNLRQDSACQESLKNNFWSDFKSLLFSRESIPQTTFLINLDEKRQVEVVVTPTETITITNMATDVDERFLQAFTNAMMFETVMDKKLTCVGSRVFFGNTFDIQRDFLEGRIGVNHNFRLTERGLLMSLDKTASSFIVKGPLLNVVKSICGPNFNESVGTISPRLLKDLTGSLCGVKVYTKYQGYVHQYTIHKFSTLDARTCKFKLDCDGEEKEVTVLEYYRTTYNIVLKYPKAPLVETTKKVFIPMELLYVKANQHYNHMLSPSQISVMIRTAASPPADTKRVITDFVNSDHSRFRLLSSFDMSVGQVLEKTNAYVLPTPKIQCGGPRPIDPFNGAWRHDDKFRVAKSISHCLVVCLDNTTSETTQRFFAELGRIISIDKRGMSIVNSSITRLETDLINAVSKQGVRYDIVFVFFSGRIPQDYKEIKRVTDTVLKIPSQCINTGTMLKMLKRGYCSNIAQKINAKLGGKNQVCSNRAINMMDVMVCGADVTHPMAGEKSISIASVVGTFDRDFTQYAGEAHTQRRSQEIITDMVSMMETLFNNYYRKNNRVPSSVIFYRDGVGDGMFSLLLREEIPKIYIAFHRCFPSYPDELKLTFIVCQKRHSVKFFPNKEDADKTGNAPPGLVVDQGIVSKDHTEFYLQSQATIKGTGRSCRYTTLVDDNNLTMETLETFTFSLCHLFNRCMRSIGICAPARYAHHLCFRARDILRVSDGDSASVTSKDSKITETDLAFDFDYTMKDKMFYI